MKDVPMTRIEAEDLNSLKKAKQRLENPGVAAKLTHLIGKPIEKGFAYLPAGWNDKLGEVTRKALTQAVHAAAATMDNSAQGKPAENILHRAAAAVSGGIGGFFGLGALALELPVSATLMLRSILDIVRSEGEDIADMATRAACIEVFALGGPGAEDDGSETGYFAVRTALAHSVAKAAEFIAQKGLAEEGAPALARLIMLVAQRFSVQVSEKAAAQAIPAIGAAGGAIVNTLFMDHFQDMARGHFVVRRLERKYGAEAVREAYARVECK